MKNIIIVLFILAVNLFAQEFVVEKVSGEVLVMKGTDENWMQVKPGSKLSIHDLISTSEKSFIQLSNNDGRFILKNNSAVNLSAIKKMTLNELLLALAAEDIRSIPVRKGNDNIRNTAVYGKEESSGKSNLPLSKALGYKRINGAKQLAENGFKESALLFAKETFRKYPETKNDYESRIYFIDIMTNLNMKNEATSELLELKSAKLNQEDISAIESRLMKIKNDDLVK